MARSARHARVEVIRGLGLGGAETLLVERLENDIAEGRLAAADVTVFNTAPRLDHFAGRIRELGVRVVATRSSSPLLGGIELLWLLVRRRADTIVAHSPAPALSAKLARRVGRARRLVQVVHSSTYKLPWLVLGRVTNWMSDLAIAVSEQVRTAPTCRGFKSVEVIHGGISGRKMRDHLSQHRDRLDALRSAIGASRSDVVVVSLGRLIATKGHADLIRAFSGTEARTAHLVIVGSGIEDSNLRAIADSLGPHNIHLVGQHVPGWEWLAAADLVCHWSQVEGLPVVLMEALALGKRVLATSFHGALEAQREDPELVRIIDTREPPALLAALSEEIQSKSLRTPNEPSSHWEIERYAKEFADALPD